METEPKGEKALKLVVGDYIILDSRLVAIIQINHRMPKNLLNKTRIVSTELGSGK